MPGDGSVSCDRTVLEAVAASVCKDFYNRSWAETSGYLSQACFSMARCGLTAAGFTEAQMQAPVGSLVVVPVEPTQEMLVAAYRVDDAAYAGGSQQRADWQRDVWPALERWRDQRTAEKEKAP